VFEIADWTEERSLLAIGAFRAFGGTAYWVVPGLTARAYRSDAGPDRLSARLAGARESALAIGPLLSEGRDRRRWLQLGLACDLADALATAIGRRRREISASTAAMCFLTYAVSALLTTAALRAEKRIGWRRGLWGRRMEDPAAAATGAPISVG
jgi:hypothetical protein